ncbi:MAG: FAD-binding oxidoreductase [Planctomycetaceae bacterium]|nr:FAD-binding oxidoreductase [Planctomycetaceae bacterium]
MTLSPNNAEPRTPADQNAVADAVRQAAQNGTPVFLARRDHASHPIGPGVVLSLAALNHVIDHAADDMTITVEAGVTVGELQRRLAEKRQRLPVDVTDPDGTTVGAAVAKNAAGPRQYAFGSMRDYLLGFTAVDGLGRLFSAGGRVVKNAAGYNLCRLMAGSRGTLALLTQVTLMVRPMPESSVFFVCDVPDFQRGERLLADLARSPARPVAIEFVAGRPRHGDSMLGPVLAGNVGRLYVGFEGPANEIDWMVEQLRSAWSAAGATAPMLVPHDRADSLWAWLIDFQADRQFNVLPGQVMETAEKLLQSQPALALEAHAGNGVVRVDEGGVEREQESFASGVEATIAQAIKDRFDPKNIFPSAEN